MKAEFQDLEVFIAVSRSLSFTTAAAKLRIDRTVITKRIQRLENAMGVRLFERTTRSVRPTEEGKLLLLRAQEVVEGFSAITDLFSKPLSPKGTVRLSAPVTVSNSILSQILPTIRNTYPEVQIELVATDRVLDFTNEGLDLAIRSTAPEDSAFVGRLLVENELRFGASPKYIKAFGIPKTVSDLKRHSLLFLDFHQDVSFRKSKILLGDFENRRSIICNDGRVLNRLAEEGAGICVRPVWDMERSFATKRLVEIKLNDTLYDNTCLYLMYPKSALLPLRTKVVIEAMVDHFRRFRANIH